MDSVDLGFKKYRTALITDPGELTVDFFYSGADPVHSYLSNRLIQTGSVIDTWQLIFSDGSTASFSGSVLGLSVKSTKPGEEMLTAAMKIQLTEYFAWQ